MSDPTNYAVEMVEALRRIGDRIHAESKQAIDDFGKQGPEMTSYNCGKVHAFGRVLDVLNEESASVLAQLKADEDRA